MLLREQGAGLAGAGPAPCFLSKSVMPLALMETGDQGGGMVQTVVISGNNHQEQDSPQEARLLSRRHPMAVLLSFIIGCATITYERAPTKAPILRAYEVQQPMSR